jgi:hypothetical protein
MDEVQKSISSNTDNAMFPVAQRDIQKLNSYVSIRNLYLHTVNCNLVHQYCYSFRVVSGSNLTWFADDPDIYSGSLKLSRPMSI